MSVLWKPHIYLNMKIYNNEKIIKLYPIGLFCNISDIVFRSDLETVYFREEPINRHFNFLLV